jgi:hypothetical protein
MGKESQRLKDHSKIALVGWLFGDLFPFQDDPSLGRVFQPGDEA